MDPHLLFIILLSITPGIEARGAFPLAYILGYHGIFVFITVFIASSIPSIPIIYGLKWLEEKIIKQIPSLDRIYRSIIGRIREKTYKVEKYRIIYLGLIFYVAIPLPGTGVWTGSLISYLLGLDRIRSIIAIVIGNLIACTIIYMIIYSISIVL